ncbi:glycosyltransferase family 39 protein [Candidatus Microgenomates bacterium]|nr:glycosyltransferase family 39 protein [Candidatus Microgenomates bacterium]
MKKNKKLILSMFALIVLYIVSRLINLTLLPIFTDEAIYLRWAQIAKNDSSWRFISLTDGKQPLFVWLAMVLMKFIKEPLLAGRLVSVFAGLAGLIGIFFLAKEVFKEKRIGFFASFLYLISPFCLMYDRMALMDSLVAAFSIWSLYFAILLVRTLRLDVALILGMILGGGILTKTSGFFSIYLLPITLLFFDWQKKDRQHRFFRWLGLALMAIIFSQIYYSVLRLSPWFHMVAQKDTTFIYPFKEWLSHPLRFFIGNLKGELDWLQTYLTWPIFILVIGSIFVFWKKTKEKLLLFIWFSAPFVALALFGKVLYPRFILFMTMPLFVLAAWSINKATMKQDNNETMNKIFKISVYCLLLVYPLYIDGKILSDPANALIPQSDLNQYINDWPAGGGVKEVIAYLQDEIQKGPIFVGTEGTFGLFPASLELYLVDHPNIKIKGYWPFGDNVIQELEEKAKKIPTFLVTKETQEVPQNWPLDLIFKIRKGKGEVFLYFYQVIAEDL